MYHESKNVVFSILKWWLVVFFSFICWFIVVVDAKWNMNWGLLVLLLLLWISKHLINVIPSCAHWRSVLLWVWCKWRRWSIRIMNENLIFIMVIKSCYCCYCCCCRNCTKKKKHMWRLHLYINTRANTISTQAWINGWDSNMCVIIT